MRNISTLLLFLIFFSGCSVKTQHLEDMEKRVNDEFIKKNKIEKSVSSKLTGVVKEVSNKQTCVSLHNSKRLSKVLEEVSQIDNKIYMLDKDQEDSLLNQSRFRVCKTNKRLAFDNLSRYFETITDKSLVVTRNAFVVDLPKIVSVVQKEQKYNDILTKDIPSGFVVENTKINHSTVLKMMASNHGYSVTILPDLASDPFVKEEIDFMFVGDDMSQFLSYLRNTFNMFIEVDYKNKALICNKYKTVSFELNIGNLEISNTDSGQTASSSGTDNSIEMGGVTSEISRNIKIYEQINEKLEFIKTNSTSILSNLKNGYKLNTNNGVVIVTSDYLTMKKYSEAIDKFNSNNMRKTKLTLLKLEIYSSATDTYGLDFETSLNLGTSKIDLGLNPVTPITNTLANLTYGGSSSTFDSFNGFLNAVHQYGYIYKSLGASEYLSNNLPSKLKLKNAGEYISKITKNVTTTDGISTTSSTNESSNFDYGLDYTVTPKITDGLVSLQLEFDNKSKPELEEKIIDTETITQIKDQSSNTIRKLLPHLRKGDVRIVQSTTEYIEEKDYKNKLPIDEFIVGGLDDKSTIKRDIVTVVYIEDL